MEKKESAWERVIEPEIRRNKYPRVNWKALLGMSLTRAVAKCKAAGLNAEQTFKTLEYENPKFSDELLRRMKIGVVARFGEMGTSQSELKRVKHGKGANGSGLGKA